MSDMINEARASELAERLKQPIDYGRHGIDVSAQEIIEMMIQSDEGSLMVAEARKNMVMLKQDVLIEKLVGQIEISVGDEAGVVLPTDSEAV